MPPSDGGEVMVLMLPGHFAWYQQWLASIRLKAVPLPADPEDSFPHYCVTPTDERIACDERERNG